MVQIRKLEDGDVAALLAWRGGDAYKNDVLVSEIALHRARVRSIFVAVVAGTLVGTVQFVPRHLDLQLGDGTISAHLQALEVAPTHRRQGIATRLIQRVESEALARGFARLTLMVEPDNRPAIQLYEARGFRFLKAAMDTWRGKAYPVHCLEKALTPPVRYSG